MSPESFRKLERWLDICDNQHACMQWARINNVPQTCPARLLDLDLMSSSPNVCLVTSKEIVKTDLRYATLSHCWGGNAHYMLLQSNLEELKTTIPFEELPKTFQDAIFVARRLRIPYLWIDSLCIIQDSHEDWIQQAGLMEQVYSNSYLNIAAADSYNSAGGLKRARDPTAILSIYLPTLDHGGALPGGFICYVEPRLGGHLLTRGWVTQERFLSPRVVHYLSDQLGWECSQCTTSEGLPNTLSFIPNAINLYKGLNTRIADMELDSEERTKDVYVLWDTLVMRYTGGDLTYSTDRPIAIAGIARVICYHLGLQTSDYHCGLWKPRFADGLVWFATGHQPERLRRDIMPGVPSWSWMSVDSEVWQDHTGRSSMYTTPIKVLDLSTHAVGDPFGPISSSFVRIRGPMCLAAISTTERILTLEDEEITACCDIILDGMTFESSKCFNLRWDQCRGQSLKSILEQPTYLILARAAHYAAMNQV